MLRSRCRVKHQTRYETALPSELQGTQNGKEVNTLEVQLLLFIRDSQGLGRQRRGFDLVAETSESEESELTFGG